MIISDEQARLAAHAASQSHKTDAAMPVAPDVSNDVIARALARAAAAPDIRTGRVEDAKERMHAGGPDARDVATKMLSRIVSDSLR